MSRLSITLRFLFLVGFVVAVPLLALPGVARRLDEFLYGGSETSARNEALQASQTSSSSEEAIVHATFEAPLSASSAGAAQESGQRGLDAIAGPLPELAPVPDFAGRPLNQSPPVQGTNPQSAFPGESGAALSTRTSQIRRRLEDLGAEYILLETLNETGEHHFECRMIVSAGLTETETFEATGNDADVVAEQVLSAVEKWRGSQASTLR